ncbi:molybdopterin-dependent oxidoreductase [Streptomyces sp. HNM0575]|uniref:molybdopterin oxidoreductase family protein n=1 Tax=Streptomyces sp. HNM0575 TaxID=2716338 RepID=UPI00145D64C9|nr:molybdopterin oxidoreductase family protein [Streptomyces sp. HNM0575]NLU76452.1 molybdopterin-dependent oxidoreductase [Streptomyces sp. HNM0575]
MTATGTSGTSAEAAPAATRPHDQSSTRLRICPLCEATCGLEVTVEAGRVTRARGNRDDVFSHGFVCPKGASFGELDSDPDRLTRPLVRGADGELRETGWDEAFAAVAAGLGAVLADGERDAVAVYLGNPNVHTMAGSLYPPQLLGALRTRNFYTASTLDQMPKHVSCGLLYGDPQAIPVPDVDRTDHLLIFGANPVESNGSLATVPDFPGRLKRLRRRGGRLTVVDPRRTRTARLADRHVAIRPGSDALLLMAMVHVLFDEGLTDTGELGPHLSGVDEVAELAREFTPEAVEDACDVPAEEIRSLARELASAESAAVYGRVGSSTVEFGTLTNWLVDVLSALTGNLDRPGGSMFPLSATARAPRPAAASGASGPGTSGTGDSGTDSGTGNSGPGATGGTPGKGFTLGRWHSRVSGHPEAKSELPVVALAEEITTPGDGRVRALITLAGNPVLSAPDGEGLEEALARLEFMVSVDPYLNETTRHADVVLPPARPSRTPHFDFAFNALPVRNQVRYTRAVVEPEDDEPGEAEILARLLLCLAGKPGAPAHTVDDAVIARTLGKAVADPHSPVHGEDAEQLAARLTGRDTVERRLDMMLRLGPYGEGFGADPDGLSLDMLLDRPHGIDLGPLRPRLPGLLRTRSGTVELCPEPVRADVPRLRAALRRRTEGDALVLVGRRHLRSNNSWMHNVPALRGGSNRCTLQIHPDDAARLGVADGRDATITGDGGEVTAPAEVTDAVRPGVVSLPHGWGHDRPGTRMRVAAGEPGVNVNQLLDGSLLDPLSGTAVLNGFAVRVAAATAEDPSVDGRAAGSAAGTAAASVDGTDETAGPPSAGDAPGTATAPGTGGPAARATAPGAG